MKTITLSRGRFAFVDDEDFPLLQRHVWCAVKAGRELWYAHTHIGKSLIRMHEMVITRPSGAVIHHEDHNGLNNQKKNLTCASQANNARHRLMDRRNKSGFKGVHWDKANKVWIAQIAKKGGVLYIGRFTEKKAAALAYDRVALKRWGQFAMTNERMGLLSTDKN